MARGGSIPALPCSAIAFHAALVLHKRRDIIDPVETASLKIIFSSSGLSADELSEPMAKVATGAVANSTARLILRITQTTPLRYVIHGIRRNGPKKWAASERVAQASYKALFYKSTIAPTRK